MRFKAVIFDMDGLMFDTERIVLETTQEAARVYGYDIPREFLLTLIGLSAPDTTHEYTQVFGNDIPLDEIRALRRELLSKKYDINLPVKDGLLELLSYVKARGVPMAVASSSRREVIEGLLKRAGVREYFNVLVSGDEVNMCKPHPEIYLKAAKTLEKAPTTCVAIEDSRFGVRSAHAAGMTAIMVPDLVEPDEETTSIAHCVLSSLHEVREYFHHGGHLDAQRSSL